MADADLIFKLYPPYAVIGVWEQFAPIMLNLRKQRNYPGAYEPLEYLYQQAKQRYPNMISRSLGETDYTPYETIGE